MTPADFFKYGRLFRRYAPRSKGIADAVIITAPAQTGLAVWRSAAATGKTAPRIRVRLQVFLSRRQAVRLAGQRRSADKPATAGESLPEGQGGLPSGRGTGGGGEAARWCAALGKGEATVPACIRGPSRSAPTAQAKAAVAAKAGSRTSSLCGGRGRLARQRGSRAGIKEGRSGF